MSGRLALLFSKLRWVGERLVAPLRTGDGPNKFRLSSVDTATTTYDGDIGWASRPPATVECPRCEAEIFQHHARDSIDCPRCVGEFSHDEFSDLELLSLTCPVCKNRMEHGQRHPQQFDIPEWATCRQCRYHWEFEHSYSE
ncbi:MAG: hypothetical protein ABEH86_10590 [Haloarcula sp.]